MTSNKQNVTDRQKDGRIADRHEKHYIPKPYIYEGIKNHYLTIKTMISIFL